MPNPCNEIEKAPDRQSSATPAQGRYPGSGEPGGRNVKASFSSLPDLIFKVARFKEESVCPEDIRTFRRRLANGLHFLKRRRTAVLPARNRGLSDARNRGKLGLSCFEDVPADVLKCIHGTHIMHMRIKHKPKICACAFCDLFVFVY